MKIKKKRVYLLFMKKKIKSHFLTL